jgi:large subunit ribosomal protein L4
MYHANLRQGSANTKTRADVAGTTKKLYRQKGTGRARQGTRKSGVRVGGGVIHGPKPRDFSYHMPQKQRQAATRAAVLGKAKDGELHLVQALDLPEIKTKGMSAFLEAIGLSTGTVLVATDGMKKNVYLSGRNMPGITVMPAAELNARAVLTHKHLVIDQAAFERLNQKPEIATRIRKPKGTRKAKGDIKGAEG